MTIDPTRIDENRLNELRQSIAQTYGIDPHRQYSERAAAGLLVPPEDRRTGSADVSTLKRKRRAGKIPYVPRGNGSVAYLGMMLVDFIAFGERSVLLWGGGDGTGTALIPADRSTPPIRDGGGRDVAQTEAMGGSDGPVHEA